MSYGLRVHTLPAYHATRVTLSRAEAAGVERLSTDAGPTEMYCEPARGVMSAFPPETVVVRRTQPLTNDLSETETVMLDIERGTYFGLKHVGKAIWEALEEPTTVDALCSDLGRRFDVDQDTCWREVGSFLRQLREHDLIEVRDVGSTS